MRYLIVATGAGGGGGKDRYVSEYIRALLTIDRHDAFVATTDSGWATLGSVVPRQSQLRLRGHGQIDSATAESFGVLDGARYSDFDVVHHMNSTGSMINSHRRTYLDVMTVHDLLPIDRPYDFRLAKRTLLGPMIRASLATTDLVLASSSATAARIRRKVPKSRSDIAVVPLAVSAALLGAHELPVVALQKRRFALVVGDMSPRKNLRVLRRAWDLIPAESRPVLVHVGPPGWGVDDGIDWSGLRAAGHYLDLGTVDDGTLKWLYRACQMCLCPSLYEGYGLPAAEAIAFGAPLIRSEDAALREASGGAGVEVDANDASQWARAVLGAVAADRPVDGRVSARREWSEVVSDSLEAIEARLGDRQGV